MHPALTVLSVIANNSIIADYISIVTVRACDSLKAKQYAKVTKIKMPAYKFMVQSSGKVYNWVIHLHSSEKYSQSLHDEVSHMDFCSQHQ